jgi:hypothetical protein
MVNSYEKLWFYPEFFEQDFVKRSKYYDLFKKGDVYGFETHSDHVR